MRVQWAIDSLQTYSSEDSLVPLRSEMQQVSECQVLVRQIMQGTASSGETSQIASSDDISFYTQHRCESTDYDLESKAEHCKVINPRSHCE
jgi:hypothetical protein